MPLRVFNVAVVGATGDGKSTLIKGFHRYANVQVVPKVLKVGAGHVSTTESCTLYSMHIKPKVAVLSSVQSDPTQLDPTQLDSNSLIARLLTDAENAEGFNLALNRVAKMTPGELAFTLIERADMEEFIVNIIDTPGCNDSDATSNPVIDADHTAAIARALGNIGTIHAVIFTIKSNRILDGATKACVGHFLSTFGGLCTNIIIAHTAFDVSKSITEQYKTNPNCPISLATKDALRDRIRAVKSQLLDEHKITATHIGIDSIKLNTPDPNIGSSFAAAHAYTALNELLEQIMRGTGTVVRHSDILKPKAVVHIDQIVAEKLETKIALVQGEIDKVARELGRSKEVVEKAVESIATLENRMEDARAKLAQLDTQDLVEIQRFEWNEPGGSLFSGASSEKSFWSKSRIHSVKKAVKAGSCVLEKESQDEYFYSVTASTGFSLSRTMMIATVVIYSLKRDVHSVEIARLKNELESMKSEHDGAQEVIQAFGGSSTDAIASINKAKDSQKAIQRARGFVTAKALPLDVFELVMGLYGDIARSTDDATKNILADELADFYLACHDGYFVVTYNTGGDVAAPADAIQLDRRVAVRAFQDLAKATKWFNKIPATHPKILMDRTANREENLPKSVRMYSNAVRKRAHTIRG